MRFKFVLAIFLTVWVIILYRLFDLTVVSQNYYKGLSSSNITRIEKIAPVRGEILDRNGKLIALNKMGFKIEIQPHLQEEELKDTIFLLKKRLNIDSLKAIKIYKRKNLFYNNKPIEVVNFIDYKTIIPHYTELTLNQSIYLKSTYKRFYPYDSVASHTIGYVSKANRKEMSDEVVKLNRFTGKSGIERFYNSYLQGRVGYQRIKVSALNREVDVLEKRNPIQNRDLRVSIDMELQQFMSDLFLNRSAVAIVMRTDGEILALGSYPEYSLNSFVSGISYNEWNSLINNIDKPFTNKAVNGLYPPASTIKPLISLSFLNSRKITPQTSYNCDNKLVVGKRNFRCWKKHGHGETDMKKAIRESCDDYFYKGGMSVGIATISRDLKRYGFGKRTGIDLPNEFIGTVPNREWKKAKYKKPWYVGETLNTSIGQGYTLSTPIQIATTTALLATGKLPTPYFIESNRKLFDPLNSREKRDLNLIREAMWEVANSWRGTAHRHLKLNSGIQIAGKTGTAQVVSIPQNIKDRLSEDEMERYRRSHSLFTTYSPYKNPKVVVTVILEHGGHGGKSVSPYISAIYNRLDEMGYLK
jgi:penicillin-binding protein 2